MLASIAAADPPAGENVQLANVANGVLNVRVRIVLVAGAEPVVRLMPPTLSLLPAKSVKVGPVPAPVLALRVGVPPSDAQFAHTVPVPVDVGHCPTLPNVPPS